MAKDPETLRKSLEAAQRTFAAKAARDWASAKNEGHPNGFNRARTAYGTVEKINRSLAELKNRK